MAADDHAAAPHSDEDDDDDEGTDTDGSNSDPTAPLPGASIPSTGSILAPHQPQGEGAAGAAAAAAAAAEESRRLFQRLWTDEEELLILRGFLEFTSRRGTAFASHQYDTGPFYEEIRRKLSFDFSKSQLIEKLRRLKKKYRVCAARVAAQGAAFAFKSAHEGAIYDVARHIWRPAFRRDGAPTSDDDDINPAGAGAAAPSGAAMEDGGGGSAPAPTPRGRGGRRVRRRTAQAMETPALPATPAVMLNHDSVAKEHLVVAVENSAPVIAPPPPLLPSPAPAPVTSSDATEEAMRGILSPLLKEFISSAASARQTGLGLGTGFGGVGGIDFLGLGFGVAGLNHDVPSDEKWRQQQIVELEVYLKRIELVREHVTAALEELRSSQG